MAFQLKKKRESKNKTIRFPAELVDKIDDALMGSNSTFSAFVIQACEYALENIDTDNSSETPIK